MKTLFVSFLQDGRQQQLNHALGGSSYASGERQTIHHRHRLCPDRHQVFHDLRPAEAETGRKEICAATRGDPDIDNHEQSAFGTRSYDPDILQLLYSLDRDAGQQSTPSLHDQGPASRV